MAVTATLSTTSATVTEGGLISGKVTLSETSILPVGGVVTVTSNGPAGRSSQGFIIVEIPAGQTSVNFSARTYEDAVNGNGTFSVTAALSISDPTPRGLIPAAATGTVVDNDLGGFTVSPASATAAYLNITRLASVPTGDAGAVATSLFNTLSDRQLVQHLMKFADATTSVALASYQFFAGITPSQAGVAYLVNSPDNPNDLNDAYYSAFNLENRYLNFAINLSLHSEGAPGFAATYGAMSFNQAVQAAYTAIIGTPGAGFNPAAAIADIQGRVSYFQQVVRERAPTENQDLAVKAAMMGYILEEGIRADVGTYARALENFYLDLMDGSASFNVSLLTAYGPGSPLDGI